MLRFSEAIRKKIHMSRKKQDSLVHIAILLRASNKLFTKIHTKGNSFNITKYPNLTD